VHGPSLTSFKSIFVFAVIDFSVTNGTKPNLWDRTSSYSAESFLYISTSSIARVGTSETDLLIEFARDSEIGNLRTNFASVFVITSMLFYITFI